MDKRISLQYPSVAFRLEVKERTVSSIPLYAGSVRQEIPGKNEKHSSLIMRAWLDTSIRVNSRPRRESATVVSEEACYAPAHGGNIMYDTYINSVC